MFVTPLYRSHASKSAIHGWVIILISLTILTLHAINLTSDTPDTFAGNDLGLRVDEGYKTLAPRNLVLFGSEQWSDADEYPGWFRGSPLTQYLLYLTFSATEANILVARATALIYYLLLTIIVLWGTRGYLKTPSLILVAAFLATEPFLFFFSRVALFEVALAVFLTAAFVVVKRINPDRPWAPLVITLILAASAFTLIKASALLFFLPALCILALFGLQKSSCGNKVAIIIFALVLICVMLVCTHGIWSRRVTLPGAGTLIGRIAANPLTALSPWLCSAALLCIVDMVWKRGRALLSDSYFLAISATVIGVPVVLGFFSYAPPRYYVAMVPTLILVVAYWLEPSHNDSHSQRIDWVSSVISIAVLSIALFVMFWATANLILPLMPMPQGSAPGISAPGAVKYLLPITICLAVLIHLMHLSKKLIRLQQVLRPMIYALIVIGIAVGTYQASSVWLKPAYHSHAIREQLAMNVSPGEAVIGDWAPLFALGTNIPAIYSTKNLNNGKVILDICPSYYIYNGRRTDDISIESYQSVGVHFGEPVALGEYSGQSVSLFPLRYPEGSCE